MAIKLGVLGRDKVTQFVGIVTAKHTYITGCDQYTLTPEKTGDGDLKDQYQFDEGRVEVIGDGINERLFKKKNPGGPQRVSISAK